MPAVFAHGALRLYLLALLEDGPKHGYEIIRALEDRFGGTYSPSAGTIYPRLAKLEAEGLVSTETHGRRTTYSITANGSAEVGERGGELSDIEVDISASVRKLADGVREELRANMRGLRADLAASAEAARGSARQSHPGTSPADSRRSVKELEVVINRFRDEVRMDLRRHAAGMQGGISDTAAETVLTVLRQAQASIRASLSGY
ncbi:PadR family transcriptional regulator [uncultured Arthrobacter sp.]|uniref:PadR family transcriptional regulator n=1 Tax=uncultured Arthrobacter sp. TaxID=114050 RepID=UPI0026077C41|nr:PadR family transcriptional regulator [uncultured Arthrobacter sp.]